LYKLNLLNGTVQSKFDLLNKKPDLFHSICLLNNQLYIIHQQELIGLNSDSGDKMKNLSLKFLKSGSSLFEGVGNDIISISSYSMNMNFHSQPILQYLEDQKMEKKQVIKIETSTNEMEEMFSKFKENIKLKNRKYHLKTYKNCFTGQEATDLIMKLFSLKDKNQAIAIGKNFTQLGYIAHVTQDHGFKNTSGLFYKIVYS
jgi:hypothetical protein